jgi:UDPglucose 6-dehydrogenase
MDEHISVVGLGKLGICLAACAASKGMTVVGVDVSPRTVRLVNQGMAPVLEPGLDEMLTLNRQRIVATHDFGFAVARSDITFVVVPTPSESHGGFSLQFVIQAGEEIGKALRHKTSYHLVVIVSTVLPGSTQFGILPVIESTSGKKCGPDFGLCYGPEFIALGDVLRGMLRPDFVLIGRSDRHAGEVLESFYRAFCDNVPQVCQMNFINAELAKLAVNTFVTTKITFANMLTAICEQLPGANIDIVTRALGCDSRIGERYLTGGLGYGGPCFPRDNRALAFTAKTLGCEASLAEATDALNRSYCSRVLSRIRRSVPRDSNVSVLGLAYKPDTNVVEDSQPLAIVRALASAGYRVTVFDPCALENARLVLGNEVSYGSSVSACVRDAQAVIVASPAKEFRNLCASDLSSNGEPIVLFDCWRILHDNFVGCGWIKYMSLGIGEVESQSSARLAQIWQSMPSVASTS